MELIRDQGFREQRGEYGSRVGGGGGGGGGGSVGGDSLDVSICSNLFHLSVWKKSLNQFLNFGFVVCHLGSRPPVCSRNCYWQKWRNDQENTE